MLDSIRRFFKSADLYKGLSTIFTALVPILISYFVFSRPEIGFAIGLGVFYNAPTNIPGSIKHRTVGMFVSIILTTLVTIIIGYSAETIWVVLPVLGIVTFGISYISVYGFRGSLVALSGLLAVVISFAHTYVNLSVFEYSFLIFVGGVWHLLMASLSNFLLPKMYLEELLSDTMKLTGDYLETRAKLLEGKGKREPLNKKLFNLQAELSTKHETIRDIILTNRQKSGMSNRIRRKFLLFIELVDILEFAVGNPVNYNKVDEIFKEKPQYIEPFVALINEMAIHLDYISKVIIRDEKVDGNKDISKLLKIIKSSIDLYKDTEGTKDGHDGLNILTNFYEYQSSQVKKIIAIERVLNVLTNNNSLKNTTNGNPRFLTPQDYGVNKLIVNFSFQSPIFRHALRLSIVMVIGYLIGYVFSIQNPYWILLTLVVIMRPSYGLTKQRMQHRVVGTLVGSVLALIVVYLIKDPVVYGVLAVISLIFALALVHLNYRNFAIFMTLHILFMYAMYSPDVIYAIQYRIIDTSVGGGLAIMANLFLFPSWEFMTINESILETLSANGIYLKKIEEVYDKKQVSSDDYKLCRKKAFLAMGGFNTAFQRMSQEPVSKRKYYSEIYDIVVLMNTFLSSLASLGTFIKKHKKHNISESFSVYIENIVDNLTNAKQLLYKEELSESHEETEIKVARRKLEKTYEALTSKYERIALDEEAEESKLKEVSLEIRQTQVVLEQLSYLFTLSESLIQKIEVYQKKID